ncbi:MAG: hypothetical protein KatS3mg087_1132 [Patescibacteria group bacterium]|nr:MAG: hypothetical protein KatS3mg087_1132 [Patescibacteria group bacterium]
MSELKYYEKYLDKDIPEEHAVYFRMIFGLSDVDSLPMRLVNEYWKTKEVYDKSNLTLTMRDLAMIVLHCGEDHNSPTEPSIGERFRRKEIQQMAKLKVKFREKWMNARLVDADTREKTLRVIIDGEGGARTIPDSRDFALPEEEYNRLIERRQRQKALSNK